MKSLLTLNEMFVSYCFTQSFISTDNHHPNYVSGNILVLITIFRFMNHGSVTNIFIANLSSGDTGRERLIRSHSSARFCFELSGNSN